jgi:hypothetical protein
MHSPLRVSNLEEMSLVARLVDVVRVLWTLAHDASNDAIHRVIGLFFEKHLLVQARDERQRQ